MPVYTQPLVLALLTGVALCTAGCAQQTAWPGEGQTMVTQQTAAVEDPPMQMIEDRTYVSPVEAVPTQQRMVPVADPEMAQRLSRLEQNVGGIQSNVSGLESDVAGLQAEVTTIRPRVAKVEAMEKHFRELSLELDRINKTYDMAPAPKPVEAKKLAPVVEKKVAPAKKAVAAPAPLKVQKVRIGEQAGGKTRIVLDTTSPAKISYDIDNGEKILVVEIPGASWDAQKSQTLKNSALISSYAAEDHDGGSRLIVQLKSDAQVASTTRLDPAEGAGYRVVLDLAKK